MAFDRRIKKINEEKKIAVSIYVEEEKDVRLCVFLHGKGADEMCDVPSIKRTDERK
jgi:hypothetical protein